MTTHAESKWNDTEYYNTTSVSEKRWTIWKCDIQNNIAADSGGGLVMDFSGFNSLAPQSPQNINILVTSTTLHGNQATSKGGNMLISYDSNGACNHIVSVSIDHCYITQGEALSGGGLYVGYVTTGAEPHKCDTGVLQHTIHITDVHFVNNTAHSGGGSIYIWDSSSVCSQINVSNSSIIGGHAEFNTVLSLKGKHRLGVVCMLNMLQLLMMHISVIQENHNTLFMLQASIL